MTPYLRPTPWDKRNFHIDTYEVTTLTEDALKKTQQYDGHYTIKIEPTHDTKLLHDYGFYYVETIIEPVCAKQDLQILTSRAITISNQYDDKEILAMATAVFTQTRFHRDFQIPSSMADTRYRNWVSDLIKKDLVIALYYNEQLAGFMAYEANKILLLGMKKEFRGLGLTQIFISHCCQYQFQFGYEQLYTAISAANLPSLNVFIQSGFKLKHTTDIYHKLAGPRPEA